MARKCTEKGCERQAAPGWTRCQAHFEAWWDRLIRIEWRWPVVSSKSAWTPGELMEAWGK